MLKKLLLVILIISLQVIPLSVLARENDAQKQSTNIEENPTPESPKKDKNNAWIYLMSFIALGTGAYLIKDKLHREELTLNVNSIESNGDGSYIVSLGYDNPDHTITFNEGDCGIRVLKGKAILLKKPNTNEFTTGLHNDEVVAVINEDSEIEYYAGSTKISIKGRDIIEKEGNGHD